MELSQAGHEIKNLGIRRVVTGVIFLGCLDDEIDDSWKTAATTATFFHCVIDFCRHDKLPTVFIQELVYNVPNVVISDVITAANQHGSVPILRNMLFLHLKQNRTFNVKKKIENLREL
jgi:hypothetical protein